MRLLLIAILLTLAAPAQADWVTHITLPATCVGRGRLGLDDGPVTIGMYSADLGTGHRACPRSEFALYARASMALDVPKFYGALQVGTLLRISHAIRGKGEIFGTVELLDWHYAQNATLKGAEARFGQTTLGAMATVYSSQRIAVSPYARVMLPTAGPDARVLTLGGEAGVALEIRANDWVRVHGFVGYDYSVGISAAPPVARNGGNLTAGFQLTPRRWFGFTLDVATHFGNRAAVDYIAPQVALRFAPCDVCGLALSGLYNAYGAERKDGAFSLHLSVRY